MSPPGGDQRVVEAADLARRLCGAHQVWHQTCAIVCRAPQTQCPSFPGKLASQHRARVPFPLPLLNTALGKVRYSYGVDTFVGCWQT